VPASILEEIRVGDYLPEERNLETKGTEAFFRLRNRILGVTRAQALRTEAMITGSGAAA
jgi:hypothetical protein